MFSPLPILIATLLLTLNVEAFPKGGSDAYYLEHTPALVARYALPPAYHNDDSARPIAKRRQSKRAVCPATSSKTASASVSAATTAPTAVATQPAVKDDGTSTIFSTRTTTVWTTKTAAAAAATSTTKTAASTDTGGLGPFTGVATWFET